jgi:sterol 14-demethylase
VAVSPNFNHVLPHVFANPTAYEPERFAAPRDEDKKKPFAWMGFGGGRHACIGQNFAYLQVRAWVVQAGGRRARGVCAAVQGAGWLAP